MRRRRRRRDAQAQTEQWPEVEVVLSWAEERPAAGVVAAGRDWDLIRLNCLEQKDSFVFFVFRGLSISCSGGYNREPDKCDPHLRSSIFAASKSGKGGRM